MKTSILTALAAVVLGTSAYADGNESILSSVAAPSDIVVFERDKGAYISSTVKVQSGTARLVDASQILLPREQAIATNGKVVVYSFNTTASGADSNGSFPRR